MELQTLKANVIKKINDRARSVPRRSDDDAAYEYLGELEQVKKEVNRSTSVEQIKEAISGYVSYAEVGL